MDEKTAQMLYVVAKVNNKIQNRNLLSSHRIKDMYLRKIGLFSFEATNATTVTCKNVSYITFGEI